MSTFVDYELRPEWQPGYIVLSYIIATLGSMVSLELMKQRTAVYGARNWMLLLGGSIALGAIGIWSMHFIGMMALTVLDANGHSVPMAFAPGLTFLSALLPIIIVAAGFLIAGDPTRPKIWKNFLAGCAGGIGVSVMHYIGMLSMVIQARTEWNGGIIFASVMIGIVAATAAMFIFFRFGKLWRSDLRLQFLTSGIMGVAVCGMHYTGMQSVKFYSSPNVIDMSNYATRDQILITILTLTSFTLAALVSLRIYYRVLLRLELEKSQCLTLQVILLDSTGSHIYVGPTGAPPSAIIEKAYVGLGELNQANQNFLRMFRTSLNWELMEQHLQQLQQAANNSLKQSTSTVTPTGDEVTDIEDSTNKLSSSIKIDSSVTELYAKFVAAVKNLSTQLNIPVNLFGKIYFEPYNSLIYIVFEPTSLVGIGGAEGPPDVAIDVTDGEGHTRSPEPSPNSSSKLPILSNQNRRALFDQLQKAGTSFRFQQISHFQKELKQYLRLEAGDGEPQQWLNKFIHFYHRVSMPVVFTKSNPTLTPSSPDSNAQIASPTMVTRKVLQARSPTPSPEEDEANLVSLLMKVGELCQIAQEELASSVATWLATLRTEVQNLPVIEPPSPSPDTPDIRTKRSGEVSFSSLSLPTAATPGPPAAHLALPVTRSRLMATKGKNYQLSPQLTGLSPEDYTVPQRMKSVNDLVKLSRHTTFWANLNLPILIKTELVRVLNEIASTTAAAQLRETTRLHIALYYGQASGFRGLQVMIPSAGPYAMIPTQPISLIENEIPLGDARMLLRDLMQVASRQADDEELSSNVVEGAANIQLALNQVGVRRNSIVGTPMMTARPGVESTNSQATPVPTAVTIGLHQPDSTTTHTPALSIAAPPMSDDKRPSTSNLTITNPSVSSSMATLRTNFFSSVRQLSQSVGTTAEFVLENLHPTLIEVAPGYHMIVFVVCKLSPIIPEHLKKLNLFIPLAMFEILHRSALTESKVIGDSSSGDPNRWTRTLLTNQLVFQPNAPSVIDASYLGSRHM